MDTDTHDDRNSHRYADTECATHPHADVHRHVQRDQDFHTDTHGDRRLHDNADSECDAHTNTDVHRNVDCLRDSHTDRHLYGDADVQCDTHASADAHRHVSSDCDSHTDTDTSSHADACTLRNLHSHPNSNAHGRTPVGHLYIGRCQPGPRQYPLLYFL